MATRAHVAPHDIVFTGVGNRIEIWDRARHEAELEHTRQNYAAYSRDEILQARDGDDLLLTHFKRGFHAQRSGDVLFVLDPYTIQTKAAATHGSPWPYDTHVPLLLLGAGVKPGVYTQQCSPAHLGPTLARLLDVESPMHAVEPAIAEVLDSRLRVGSEREGEALPEPIE